MKRSLCITLAMLMVICLLPITVVASSDIWNGAVASGYADGTGTEEDPYQIANGQQLAYLAQQVNEGVSYEGEYFVLANDIALNDTTNWQSWSDTVAPARSWTPIGLSSNNPFAGSFDGGNHAISGMYFNTLNDYSGLFGVAIGTSTIKNLGVTDSYVYSIGELGGIGAIVGVCEGLVLSCYNTGTVVGRNNCTGGIVGGQNGDISDCYNTGTVVGGFAGGICGTAIAGSVTNCWNTGTIIREEDDGDNSGGIMGGTAGGIVGDATGEILRSCYNNGEVRSDVEYAHVGGIAGRVSPLPDLCAKFYFETIHSGRSSGSESVIYDCYNSGSISATLGYVGGLAGFFDGCSSQNSYSAGKVTGSINMTGSIAGSANSNTFFSSIYYLDDGTSPVAVGEYRTNRILLSTYSIVATGTAPLTDAEMRVQSNFTGFDFTEVWAWAHEGDELYPYAYPIFASPPIAVTLTTLGCAARFDKTAIRFGASVSIADLAALNVGDTIDYGFNFNGLKDNILTYDIWTRLSAASTELEFTGFSWTEDMDNATTTESLTAAIRATGIKVYSYDSETITFAIIINNLPAQAQDSLWVFEPYVTINATDTSMGDIKYNSINRILGDIPSDIYIA